MQRVESILDVIQVGDVVRILRFGHEVVGQAVMRTSVGWVIYVGGPNKGISIATTANITSVSNKEAPAVVSGLPGSPTRGNL